MEINELNTLFSKFLTLFHELIFEEGRWLSPTTPASFTKKHDRNEIIK